MVKKIVFFVVIIICLAALGALGTLAFLYFHGNLSPKYYAVYLDTGELYFGKLSRFPRLSLSNVWYLQKNLQTQELSLSDFSKSLWGPKNKISINSDKVVWISEISDSSQLIPVLKGETAGSATNEKK